MHKSRLYLIVIDVNDLVAGIEFWGAALKAEYDPSADNDETVYKRLKLPEGDTYLLLQKVPEQKTMKNHMHIDIATDDIEAEASRLELLGATRIQKVSSATDYLWVMQDPFGNEFCVLSAEHQEVMEKANVWST